MKLALQIVLILLASIVAALIAFFVIMGPGEEQPSNTKDADLILDQNPIINDNMPFIDDETIQNDMGYVPPPQLSNDYYELMQQRYDNFVKHYQSLVLSQRNVIPYPVNYSYTVEEGFTDKENGIKYCTIIDNHLANVESLFSGLNQSLDQIALIEEKSPEIIELIDVKYKVLSGVIFDEINILKYQYQGVNCDELFGDESRIDYVGDKIIAD